MSDYTRKRYKQLKKAYPDEIIILSQNEECSRFWIYDKDAEYVSDEIGGWPFSTKKGLCLVVDVDDIPEDSLQRIPEENGAFFFAQCPIKFKSGSLPPSALASVSLSNGSELKTCIIVGSAGDQNGRQKVFWGGRSDYARILYAIAENLDVVELGVKPGVRGSLWHIVEYEITDAFSDFVNHLDYFIRTVNEPKTILICEALPADVLEEVTAYFFTSGNYDPVPMTVFYSAEDGAYYLDVSTYNVYRSRYGLPFIKLSLASKGVSSKYIALAKQSELFLYGYSVSQKEGLPTGQRQKLLANLMDNGLLSKQKIESHISWLIKQNENNSFMVHAVASWKNDIKFVNSYRITDNKTIWVKSFVKHQR